jgi:hypothetical protein
MCAPPGEAASAGHIYFAPEIKCCTFLPRLPNFIVGRILHDDGADVAEGRASVEARIDSGLAVTPLGVGIPAPYALLYGHSEDAFGRAHALRCPHYLSDGGRCGIWRHREATCATWFCKYVRGKTGEDFWKALFQFLRSIEDDLVKWCIEQVGLEDGALEGLLSPDGTQDRLDSFALDGRVDRKACARVWGEWNGRERDFYRECGRAVESLSWIEVLDICGPAVRLNARIARQAYQRLMDETIPASLRVGRCEVVNIKPLGSTIRTYRDFDPIHVPRGLFEALSYFDGRETSSALKAISEERGIDVSESEVRELVDFRILVPADVGKDIQPPSTTLHAQRSP